jgi:hypothetical protein
MVAEAAVFSVAPAQVLDKARQHLPEFDAEGAALCVLGRINVTAAPGDQQPRADFGGRGF